MEETFLCALQSPRERLSAQVLQKCRGPGQPAGRHRYDTVRSHIFSMLHQSEANLLLLKCLREVKITLCLSDRISLLYENPQHHQRWQWVQKSFKCSPSCVVFLKAGNRDYFLIGETRLESSVFVWIFGFLPCMTLIHVAALIKMEIFTKCFFFLTKLIFSKNVNCLLNKHLAKM